MIDPQDIHDQQALLRAHRQTLAVYLQQRALLGATLFLASMQTWKSFKPHGHMMAARTVLLNFACILTRISIENDNEWTGDIIHMPGVSAYDLSDR
jgi:hypothetical protein